MKQKPFLIQVMTSFFIADNRHFVSLWNYIHCPKYHSKNKNFLS